VNRTCMVSLQDSRLLHSLTEHIDLTVCIMMCMLHCIIAAEMLLHCAPSESPAYRCASAQGYLHAAITPVPTT
jgi:hypothetical protein